MNRYSLDCYPEENQGGFDMKKFNKNLNVQNEGLRALIKCSCYHIQCGCDDIYDPRSVQLASEDSFDVVKYDVDASYN